jgi:oligosaccharyl transferase complex subunit OST4
MISDDELYRLAIALGSIAMILIILYHFLEINAVPESTAESKARIASSSQADAKAGAANR